MFIAALFTVVKIWKQHTDPLTEELTETIWGIYIHIYACVYKYMYTHTMESYSNIKKNEMMLLATTWMHLE